MMVKRYLGASRGCDDRIELPDIKMQLALFRKNTCIYINTLT